MKLTDERTGTIRWQTFAIMVIITSICLTGFVFILFPPVKHNGIEARTVVTGYLIMVELFIYSFWWLNEVLTAKEFNNISIIQKELPTKQAKQLADALKKQFIKPQYEIKAIEQELFKWKVCSYGYLPEIEKMRLFAKGWLEARK